MFQPRNRGKNCGPSTSHGRKGQVSSLGLYLHKTTRCPCGLAAEERPSAINSFCHSEAPSCVVVSVEATWTIVDTSQQVFYLRSSEELVIPQPPSSTEKLSSPGRSKKPSKPSEEKPKEIHTNTIIAELLKIKKKF